MQILCCPVNLNPETARSLRLYAPQAEVVVIERGDDFAYWRTIRERWGTGEPLLIIEQDIEFNGDQLQDLRNCPQPWCLYGYYWKRNEVYLNDSLGFTRYSSELMAEVPIASIGPDHIPSVYEVTLKHVRDADGNIDINWNHIDRQVSYALRRHGFIPHVHGTVEHHHDPEDPRKIAPSS